MIRTCAADGGDAASCSMVTASDRGTPLRLPSFETASIRRHTARGGTIDAVPDTPIEAITKLVYTYAERIDLGDFAGVGELFDHATLTFEGFGDAVRGQEAIEALYGRTTRRFEDGTPRTKHVMTNLIVDVDDEERTASSRSYFTVLQAVPGELALQPVIAGRYRHRYERAAEEWRVTAMHIMIDLMGDLSSHMLFDLQP